MDETKHYDRKLYHRAIQIYEANRFMWDPREKEYYNKNKREEIWQKISVELDINIAELKKKINSLLGSFRREKSRENRSKLSGAKNVYKSKWFAYRWFAFLNDKNLPNDTTDPLSDIKKHNSDDDQDPSSDEASPSPAPSTSQNVKKRRLNDKSRALEAFKNKLHTDSNESILRDAYKMFKPPADHYETFGRHVASELRKYDADLVPHIKKAILDIFYQADTGQYDFIQGFLT